MTNSVDPVGRDRVALVTGAGRGLGAAIALGLAQSGFRVAANDLSPGLDAIVAQIHAAGGAAIAVRADVTDEDGVRHLVQETESAFDAPVYACVANATGPQPEIALEQLSWQDHLNQLDYFVKSPTLLAQAVVPGMRRLGGGRLIHIGSDLFERAAVGMSAYGAAKGALLGLTRAWALELGPAGITVNLVAPGWIPVERHDGLPVEDYQHQVPLQRMGTPSEVSDVVTFLAGDTSRFITGQRLAVNGGHVFF